MLGLLAGLIGHERCRHCGRFDFMIQSAAVVTFNSSGSLAMRRAWISVVENDASGCRRWH